MEPQTAQHLEKGRICDLCLLHDPMVKDYSEDVELQNSIKDYVKKSTGDNVSVSDIAKLCDSCYYMVNDIAGEPAEQNN